MILEKEEREKERGRNIDHLLPVHALMGDQTHNLGLCPDPESNMQTFGVQEDAPTNCATQPGLSLIFNCTP